MKPLPPNISYVERAQRNHAAFSDIRNNIMHMHGAMTLKLMEGDLDTLNREYDLVSEIIAELEHYMRGETLDKRFREDPTSIPTNERGKYVFSWKGKQYAYWRVRPHPEPEEGWHTFGVNCRFICGGNWRRPHFTCVRRCWGHKIWYGHMPPVIEFRPMTLITQPFRPKWKYVAQKALVSILEWITS